jgi:hypothetical protein
MALIPDDQAFDEDHVPDDIKKKKQHQALKKTKKYSE